MSESSGVNEIIRDVGRLEGRVTQLAETIDRDRATAASNYTSLNTKLDLHAEKTEKNTRVILEKLDAISLKEAQVQGAWKLAAWFGGIMATIGALLATFTKYFWNP